MENFITNRISIENIKNIDSIETKQIISKFDCINLQKNYQNFCFTNIANIKNSDYIDNIDFGIFINFVEKQIIDKKIELKYIDTIEKRIYYKFVLFNYSFIIVTEFELQYFEFDIVTIFKNK